MHLSRRGVFFQEFPSVGVGFPIVHHNGFAHFFCQKNLPFKPFFLKFTGRKIVVVIKPDFPHRHAFGVRKKRQQFIFIKSTAFLCLMGMHPASGVNIIVFLCQIQRNFRGSQITPAVDYPHNPFGG